MFKSMPLSTVQHTVCYLLVIGLCTLSIVFLSLPSLVLADEINVECSNFKNPKDGCIITPNPGALSNLVTTLDEINQCKVDNTTDSVICQTKIGANFSCTKASNNTAICTFADDTEINCSNITASTATCTINGPSEAQILTALQNIASPLQGPKLSIAQVLAKICIKRNVLDILQRECDAFIGAALFTDANNASLENTIHKEAKEILTQITPDGASASIDASQMSLRAQSLNITSRLTELRQQTNKTSRLSFNLTGFGANNLSAYMLEDDSNAATTSPSAVNPINFGRLGLFFNGSIGQGNRDAIENDNEQAFKVDTMDITGGADYRFRRDLFFGLAFGYSANETTLNSGRGSLSLAAYNLILYGTYYPNEEIYINASLNYTGNRYEQQRNIKYTQTNTFDTNQTIQVNQIAQANYFGLQTTVDISAGYQFTVQGLTAEPYVQLQLGKTNVDDYRENMSNPNQPGSGWAVIIDGQNVTSLISAIGTQLTYAFNQSWGVLIPQARVEWLKQLKNDVHFVEGKFAGDPNNIKFRLPTNSPDTRYFNVGLGISALLPNGRTAYLYYQKLLSFDDFNYQTFSAGMRWEF